MSTRVLSLCCFVFAAIGLHGSAVQAADSTSLPAVQSTEPRPSAPEGAIDVAELESLLDRFLDEKMEEMQVPGAAVSVVKDGEILLARGYGLADIENEVPVDPATTRFYVASVSKLFTATAVMQLSERGLLSLDDDVSQHLETLGFERRFTEPLTASNLLTHSGGINDAFLFSTVPVQILPAGDIVSYSNAGIDTAGQLVAAVSGLAFEDYLARNVLEPLSMPSSSFDPLPETSPEAPIGYSLQQGKLVPNRNAFTDVVPSGSLSSTATEMGHFMIAHLQGGRYGDEEILAPETVQRMHRRQATNHPGIPGVTYGFWESTRSGVRVLDHKGDGTGFHARLFLLPEKRLGVFFVCNRQAYGLSDELADALIARLYPADLPAEEPVTSSSQERYLGSYRWLRVPRKGLGKILGAGMGAMVQPAEDGAIHVGFGGLPIPASTLRQVEPGVFRAPSGEEMAFRTTSDGRVTHLFSGPFAFERLPWYENPVLLAAAGLLFLGTFFLGAAFWPLASLARRLRRKGRPAGTSLTRAAKALAGSVGLLNFGFVIGLLALLLSMAARQSFSISPPLKALLFLPYLSVVLAVAVAACAVLLWRHESWSLTGRLAYTVYALAALAFIPYLAYYNLLGLGL